MAAKAEQEQIRKRVSWENLALERVAEGKWRAETTFV